MRKEAATCAVNRDKKERKYVEDIDQNEVRIDIAGTGGIGSRRVRHGGDRARTDVRCDPDGIAGSGDEDRRTRNHPHQVRRRLDANDGRRTDQSTDCSTDDSCRGDREAPSDGRRPFGRQLREMVGDRGDGAWRRGSSWLRATDETALPLRRLDGTCEQRNSIAASWRIHERRLRSVEMRAA